MTAADPCAGKPRPCSEWCVCTTIEWLEGLKEGAGSSNVNYWKDKAVAAEAEKGDWIRIATEREMERDAAEADRDEAERLYDLAEQRVTAMENRALAAEAERDRLNAIGRDWAELRADRDRLAEKLDSAYRYRESQEGLPPGTLGDPRAALARTEAS